MPRFVLAALLAAGCSGGASSSATDGATIYAQMCARCHGPNGKPTAQMFQAFGVKDLTDPELRARMTPATVLEQVRKGSKNGIMPSFVGALEPAQMEAVAAFVASPELLQR